MLINNNVPSINMSTEFFNKDLVDPISYKVSLRSFQDSKEIPQRYKPKERKIKEYDSIGSFRINACSLKKRVNPSDEYEEYLRSKKINVLQSSTNNDNNLFTYSSNYLQNNNQFNQNIDINSIINHLDPNEPVGTNLISLIDSKIQLLKDETELQLKNSQIENTKQQQNTLLDEKNVNTHFIAATEDRMQMLKHVQTKNKPEYMSIEQIQKEKEENAKKLIELEKQYNLLKDEKYQRLLEEQEKLNKKYNYKPEITIDLLNSLLKQENEIFHFDKKLRRKKTSSSARLNSSSNQKVNLNPLNKNEEKYVKNLAKYTIKKKIKEVNEEKDSKNYNEWNKTRIHSKNIRGVVSRSDGLPGYFGKEDYSLYYCNILDRNNFDKGKFKAPHWGSVSSKSQEKNRMNQTFTRNCSAKRNKSNFSRNMNEERLNQSAGSIRGMNIEENKPDKEIKEVKEKKKKEINDIESFIDKAFNELDTKKIGYVTKSQLCTEMNLNYDNLQHLGFSSKQDFIDKVNKIETKLFNHLSREELNDFLTKVYNDYLEIKKQKEEEEKEKKKKEEEGIPFLDIPKNEEELIEYLQKPNNDDDEDDFLPVFHRRDILESNSNIKRLQRLKEEIDKNQKLLPPKPKEPITTDTTFQNKKGEKVVAYEDYKTVINKFSSKDNINFTIPKPFSFNRKNAASAKVRAKSLNKMKTMFELREEKERENLGNQFRANQLKNEMFIGNIDNLIEADKKERRKRVEKRMEKIQQEMKPFSFVQKDEEKLKEKRKKIEQIEKSKLEFPKFKANPVKWTTKVAMIENIEEKNEKERKERVEKKAKELYEKSKLPPRLEMHEKEKEERKKKMIENNKKLQKDNQKHGINQSKKFDPTIKLPNYNKLQQNFEKKIQDDKNKRKKTVPEPFEFHQTNKKINNQAYYDEQNKLPQFKKNALEMIRKLQQKDIVEPPSTKGLNMLVQQRRKEQEEKKKEEERIKLEDKNRKIEQAKLTKKIHQSERLKDNKKNDLIKQKEKEKQFKASLKEQEQKHNEYLSIIKQKIYNRGFMFENSDVKGEIGLMEKLRMKKIIEEAINNNDDENEEEQEDKENIENEDNKEENYNEEEFENKQEEDENDHVSNQDENHEEENNEQENNEEEEGENQKEEDNNDEEENNNEAEKNDEENSEIKGENEEEEVNQEEENKEEDNNNQNDDEDEVNYR